MSLKIPKIIWNNLIANKELYLFFFSILLVIFTNQLHLSYPDEFENILGGKFILQGRLPYTGFFIHHNPFAYFFAAFLNIFSGISFVKFRLLFGLTFFLSLILFFRFIRKNFGKTESIITLFATLFLVFGATYFWGQMLLGDTLSIYLITPAFITLFFCLYNNKILTLKLLIFISTLLSLSLMTSMSVVYAVFVAYLLIGYLFLTKKVNTKWYKVILILLTPYIIFAAYLIITRSLHEYYLQAIRFNTDYYIKLPDNASITNPLSSLITLQVKFIQNFKAALLLSKDLNFGTPFVHALSLSSAIMVIFLLFQKRYSLAIFLWLYLTYISARGNPYTTSETDYQAIGYQLTSIFNGVAVTIYLWTELATQLLNNKRVVYSFLLILVGLYNFSLLIFFFDRWLDKTYQKYTGTAPLIYDRPTVAPVLNQLLGPNDYYYIGPFDFENQLYLNSIPATKYIVALPGMDNSPRIQNEITEDLIKHHPKIIIFHTEMRVYGIAPGRFLLDDYIAKEYFNLEQLGIKCLGYAPKTKWYGPPDPHSYDFERHFFFSNDMKGNIIQYLLDKGLIYPVSSAC